jgi:hypothetical protein
MIQKINQKNLHGEELYREVTTTEGKKVFGEVGTLSALMKHQIPSKRKKHHKH